MAQTTHPTPHREFLEILADLTHGPRAGSRFGAEFEGGTAPATAAARTRSRDYCPDKTEVIGGRAWCVAPARGTIEPIAPRAPGKAKPGDPPAALAEIKPHSPGGLYAGLKQLRGYDPDIPRYLVTYRPVGVVGDKARAVSVYAIRFGRKADVPAGVTKLRGKQWAHWGEVALPPVIRFPRVTDAGFFGSAVEGLVRGVFGRTLVSPANRQLDRGSGGHHKGPDAVARELAEFYDALARELGDPMLAELAAELLRGPVPA